MKTISCGREPGGNWYSLAGTRPEPPDMREFGCGNHFGNRFPTPYYVVGGWEPPAGSGRKPLLAFRREMGTSIPVRMVSLGQ